MRAAAVEARSLSGGKKRELSMPLHAACSCHAQQPAPRPGSRDESAIPLFGSRSIGAIRDARSVTGPAPVQPWIVAVNVGIAVSPTPVRAPPATLASRRSKVVIARPSDVPGFHRSSPADIPGIVGATPAIRPGTSLGSALPGDPRSAGSTFGWISRPLDVNDTFTEPGQETGRPDPSRTPEREF